MGLLAWKNNSKISGGGVFYVTKNGDFLTTDQDCPNLSRATFSINVEMQIESDRQMIILNRMTIHWLFLLTQILLPLLTKPNI